MAEQIEVTKTTDTTHTSAHARTQPQPRPADGGPSMLSSVLAIVGFIIIIIWGLFHIATLSQPWLSSLFNKTTNTSIQVSAPTTATSSIPFTVSWKYYTTEKGAYAFLYQCKSGFHFEVASAGGTAKSLPCGAAITVPTDNAMSITPVLSGSGPLAVPLSIIFMPSPAVGGASATSSKQAQGTATVVINAGTFVELAQPVTTKPATVETSSKPVTPVKPHVSGPADLSVRIVAVNVDASGNGIATFDIANVGGSSSGIYYFNAQLPMQTGYTYNSPPQSPLGPGDHIVNTLRFSQAVNGVFSIALNVSDANQNNNYASQSISMPSSYAPGYGGTQYNNYNYAPQPYQYAY